MDTRCPACGGSGGGPFGPPGGVWDREDYECPRCRGTGVIAPEGSPEGPELLKSVPAPSTERRKTGTEKK